MARSSWLRRAIFLVIAVAAIAIVGYVAKDLEFDELVKKGWLFAYLGVFAAGVGTALTPCVYPMIPIVVGIFGAKEATRGKAFVLATIYVVGMGLMFGSLGIGASFAGKATTGMFLANPWVVVPLVLLYVALAAAMFGFYELQLPAGLQARLNRVGGKGYGGAFSLGLVGGLTAAPCTGPILLGILGLVAGTGDIVLGFSLLFTYALGIGVLFWVLAVTAIDLPKSGAWMETVKSVGGILLLVAGIYFLRPVWPLVKKLSSPDAVFALAALGIAAIGFLLGAAHLSFHGPVRDKVRKTAGIVLAVVGLGGVVNWALTPRIEYEWHKSEETALALAREAAAPMLVDFGAEWCAPCKVYETQIFADPRVEKALEGRFVLLKFDVTEQEEHQVEAQKRWQAQALPTVILLDSEGKEHRRFSEPIPSAEEFAEALKAVP